MNHHEELISQLREQLLIRDTKILHLSQKISQLTLHNDNLLQQQSKLQLILKSRNNSLNQKNIRINQLQQQMGQFHTQQHSLTNTKIQQLQTIISQQQQELNTLMKDHETMISSMNAFYHEHQYELEEKELLRNFNAELQHQINEVEQANIQLIERAQHYEEELSLQNQQGNDLLSHLQLMTEQMINVN